MPEKRNDTKSEIPAEHTVTQDNQHRSMQFQNLTQYVFDFVTIFKPIILTAAKRLVPPQKRKIPKQKTHTPNKPNGNCKR